MLEEHHKVEVFSNCHKTTLWKKYLLLMEIVKDPHIVRMIGKDSVTTRNRQDEVVQPY